MSTGEPRLRRCPGGFDIDRLQNVRQVAGLTAIPRLAVKEEMHAAVAADLVLRQVSNLGSGLAYGNLLAQPRAAFDCGLVMEHDRP